MNFWYKQLRIGIHIGIELSYRPASLCSLAIQFQTRFLELIPRPIAVLKFPTLVAFSGTVLYMYTVYSICTVLKPFEIFAQLFIFKFNIFASSSPNLFIHKIFFLQGENMGSSLCWSPVDGSEMEQWGEMIFAQKMGLKTFSRWKAGKSYYRKESYFTV